MAYRINLDLHSMARLEECATFQMERSINKHIL